MNLLSFSLSQNACDLTGIELTEDQEEILDVISLLKQKDSKFVLELMRMLYADNLHVLTNRTAGGRAKRINGSLVPTNQITPEKKHFIVKKMEERIFRADIKDKHERYARTDSQQVVLHISHAINNIRRQLLINN